MQRFLSLSRRNNSVRESKLSEKGHDNDSQSSVHGANDDNASTAILMPPPEPLAPANLKVKRVDYYYSRWSRSWKYKNMGEKVTPEAVPVP